LVASEDSTRAAAGDPALSALAEHYDQLSPLLHVGCPPTAIVERCINKALLWSGAKMWNQGSFTCTLGECQEMEQAAAQLRFPVVASWQKGASFPGALLPTLEMLSKRCGIRSGAGLAAGTVPRWRRVEMLLHKGNVGGIPARRLKELPPRGSRSDCDRPRPRSRAGGSVK